MGSCVSTWHSESSARADAVTREIIIGVGVVCGVGWRGGLCLGNEGPGAQGCSQSAQERGTAVLDIKGTTQPSAPSVLPSCPSTCLGPLWPFSQGGQESVGLGQASASPRLRAPSPSHPQQTPHL